MYTVYNISISESSYGTNGKTRGGAGGVSTVDATILIRSEKQRQDQKLLQQRISLGYVVWVQNKRAMEEMIWTCAEETDDPLGRPLMGIS